MLIATGCETVDVTVVESERIVLSPPEQTLIEGASASWTAALLSADGDPLSGRTIVWSSADPGVGLLSGPVGDRVTVEAVAAGTTTIRASADGHSATATLEVLAGPSIALEAMEVVISGRQGEQASALDVGITNGGNGVLSGLSTRVVYADNAPEGWLAVGLNGTTAPTSLTLLASAVGLTPGDYPATIEVSSPSGGGLLAILDVVFEVAPPPPIIELEADGVGLSSSFLNPIPASAVVGVANAGAGTLDELSVSIEYFGGDPGGWLTATLASTEAPTTLQVSASALGLRTGDYSARVALSSPHALESPVYLAVTFRVAAPGSVARAHRDHRP